MNHSEMFNIHFFTLYYRTQQQTIVLVLSTTGSVSSLHLLPLLHHGPGPRRGGVQLPALQLLQEAEQRGRLADPGNIKYNYIWLIISCG